MRIAIICTLYPPYILGGAEISTSILAKGLVNKGHEVSVITTGDKDSIDMIDGVTVYRIKNKNIYWRYPQREKPIYRKILWHLFDIYNIRYQRKLSDLLDTLKPEIVHTGNLCGLSCVVWNVAHTKKIPIVHTLRDYYLLCPQQTMMKNGQSCQSQCMVCRGYSVVKKMMSQKVKAIVGISNFILKQHRKYGYFKNASFAQVIPNSVEAHSCQQLDKDTCLKDVGYIGRISPEKGLELMIEAFLQSNHGKNRLKIAGSGNAQYMKRLQEQYRGESVVFCGTSKPSDFFPTIGLLIVPSLWNEPFGRVVIEAYSYHTPVVMSNNGGLTELAAKGVSQLFSTHDTVSLTGILNRYFQDKIEFDYERFDIIVSQYAEDAITNEYIELYKKCVSK